MDRTGARHKILSWLLLLGTCLLVVAVDRLVLAAIGQTRWQYDPALGYRMRPHWPLISYTGVESGTNAWGFHDDDFAAAKPAGQLRGLIVGDSVTMGRHLPRAQHYANQLEDILGRFDVRHADYQVINTGVEGYDTGQARQMLEETLRFAPDFIAVGLCLNDITDPYVLDRDLGGSGSYSGMRQAALPLWGYLLNETGFGRLALKANEDRQWAEQRRLAPLYSVERMVQSVDEGQWAAGWTRTLDALAAIYRLARERDLPVVLVVFPYTFQLLRPEWQRPQARLVEHAERHGADWINYAPLFEEASYMRLYRNLLQPGTAAVAQDEEGELVRFAAEVYFRDFNHFTAAGHQLVALQLAGYLRAKGLVDIAEGALAQYREELEARPVVFDRRLPHDGEYLRERQRILLRLGLLRQAQKIEVLIRQQDL